MPVHAPKAKAREKEKVPRVGTLEAPKDMVRKEATKGAIGEVTSLGKGERAKVREKEKVS